MLFVIPGARRLAPGLGVRCWVQRSTLNTGRQPSLALLQTESGMTTFDLAGWMQASRRFYRDHNLADWERAVPPDARLSPGQDATLRQAEKAGFTRGFAFPPFDLQRAQLDRLIDETARKPAPLPDTQQYAEPFLSDEW